MACGWRVSHTPASSAERGCPLVSSRGGVGIDAKNQVAVSARFVGRGPAAEVLVLDMLGRTLYQPLRGARPADAVQRRVAPAGGLLRPGPGAGLTHPEPDSSKLYGTLPSCSPYK